jgi:hypothetical protein
MDVYRALNADVPWLLFTVLHQANATVSDKDYTRAVIALHMDIRRQMQMLGEQLHYWLQKQYAQQAEETVQKLQRLAALKEDIDLDQVRAALVRDYTRLGNRIGSQSLLSMQGSAEEIFSEETPADPDLARRVVDGRNYLASLGFKPGQGSLHETWLLFRGSIHYDVLEHVLSNLLSMYKGSFGSHTEYVARTSVSTYNLIYQVDEGLTDELAHDAAIQEVTFAFTKGALQHASFRQEVNGLLEQIADQVHLLHASFWQCKLGLGTGKEFMLRLRLPAGEEHLREMISLIAARGHVGDETIVKQGKLLLGRRVL